MWIIAAILLLMLLLPDAYIVWGVMKDYSWWWKGLFLLPTVAYIVLIILLFAKGGSRQAYFNWIFWLTLCVVFPVVIFTIFSLIGLGGGLIHPKIYTVFNWIALGIAGCWLFIALYGIGFGWRKVTVENLTLQFPNLPSSFRGYKIVQLSDLHIGTYDLAPGTVDRIVEKVNSLKPDLIVFTGDIVNSVPEELNPYMEVLEKLKAPDGVISILGNHDYCFYRSYAGTDDSPEKAKTRVIEKERDMGWEVLLNSSREIVRGNDKIAIIGVENSGGKNFINLSDLKKAMKGINENEFKILLSHDPSQWRREVLPESNIDLTLSGHTHAMQFKIGNFSPSEWAYKEWGGLYEEGNRKLHVNTGTGGNIAFRFGAYPQITVITLEPES